LLLVSVGNISGRRQDGRTGAERVVSDNGVRILNNQSEYGVALLHNYFLRKSGAGM